MQVQKIKIDVVAYLYDGYEQFLDNFYEKVEQAVNTSRYKNFLDIEKTADGIRLTSELENEIEWEVDDYGCIDGSGHYNGVLDRTEFMYDLNKFLKGVDKECYCELDDNSDFGGM